MGKRGRKEHGRRGEWERSSRAVKLLNSPLTDGNVRLTGSQGNRVKFGSKERTSHPAPATSTNLRIKVLAAVPATADKISRFQGLATQWFNGLLW